MRRLVVFLLLAALLGGGTALALASSGAGARAFDRATWRGNVAWCESSPRGAMVDDLVKNHLRPGMPMRAVRTLLGTPDEINSDGTWSYDVDAESGLLDTCVTLELYPGHGRLRQAVISRDS